MACHDSRRPFKRIPISDQQKRRDLSIQRQAQSRRNVQQAARCLISAIFSLESQTAVLDVKPYSKQDFVSGDLQFEKEEPDPLSSKIAGFHLAVPRLKGGEARKIFARLLMRPEWMIDIPESLSQDWYVFSRPAGKRCFVVSHNGRTVSRLRNGSILHKFSSALPNGAKRRDASGPAQSYCIVDCIYQELDQTYYVIDMVCWQGYFLFDCTAEFRFFWLNSKLEETSACDPPSPYNEYQFYTIPVYSCDQSGLDTVYTAAATYVKDGLLFYNKHSHYQTGNTPLALVWKDDKCSQYVVDTDSEGQVPCQQQVVLELQEDGKLITSDDPPVAFGCLDLGFIQSSGLHFGNLLRFTIANGGLSFAGGRLENADMHYLSKANHARVFADSYSKVIFQHLVRHSPLKFDDLLFSVCNSQVQQNILVDDEMLS